MTFRLLGVDRGGRTAEFSMPLAFVPDAVKDLSKVVEAFNQNDQSLRTVGLGGQVLSVAPPAPAAPDASDVVANRVTLRAVRDPGRPDRVKLTASEIRGALPALQRFAPSAAGEQVVAFAQPYLDHGLGGQGNPGEVLLKLIGGAPTVDLGDPDVTGGMVRPQFPLTALSRIAGPVGGAVDKLAGGKVKAKEVLGELIDDVTLFGVFPLEALIGSLDLDVAKDVPRLATKAFEGVSTPSLHWEVPLFTAGDATVPAKPAEVEAGPVSGTISAIPGRQARLLIDVTTEVEQPVPPVLHTRATTRVENVSLTLGLVNEPLVTVPVESMSFVSVDGRKPELDAQLGDLQFHGVLGFLRQLADLVPNAGFSDPPAIDVTDDGVRSSFDVPLPPVASGMFVLENITFSAALDLWFAKPPELSLAFSTPENRFRLTVLALGGGGYLGIKLSTRGLERLDGMLEFGAAVSVHLGVASGSVSVMGGVQFAYDRTAGASLAGYLEVRGEVEVLKVLEVAVKLLVVLAYDFATETLAGRAEMEVSVRVLFWRKTVRVPFAYEFAGGGADGQRAAAQRALGEGAGMPGFLDQMAPADWPDKVERPWDTYCQAFA